MGGDRVVVLAALTLASPSAFAATEATVALVAASDAAPLRFALDEIQHALLGRGIKARIDSPNGGASAKALLRIVVAVAPDPARPAQGFVLRFAKTGGARTLFVEGADVQGAMYGGLDVAETIALDGVAGLRERTAAPYLRHRGVKINAPLDARTPSFSDAGDSAWKNVETMWDFSFWQELFDRLARDRYDTFTLWSLHPFPSLVKVPEFPKVALADVMAHDTNFTTIDPADMVPAVVLEHLVRKKTMSMDDKIAFWRKVMRAARDRGVAFHIAAYNCYTHGTAGQYGITPSIKNPVTKDYMRSSVRELVLTYPDLAGIEVTTRPTTTGTIAESESWLWDTYGRGILDAKAKAPDRKVTLVRRGPAPLALVESVFKDYPDELAFSDKYPADHLYATTKPHAIDAAIASIPKGRRMWLELRNNSLFYLRFGDPEFARDLIRNMPPLAKVAGLDFGADAYTWGREVTSVDPESPRASYFAKHWFETYLWGRLGYDPELPASTIEKLLSQQLATPHADALLRGWSAASKIIPLVSRFRWSASDIDWYPEANYSHPIKHVGFYSARDFITGFAPMPREGIIGIRAFVEKQAHGESAGTDRTPPQIATELRQHAERALASVAGLDVGAGRELAQTVGDVRAFAWLGAYYAAKIEGATEMALAELPAGGAHRLLAVAAFERAASAWRRYATESARQYKPQRLTLLGPEPVDLRALLAKALADLALVGAPPRLPSATITPGGVVLEVEAATDASGKTSAEIPGFSGTGYVVLSPTSSGEKLAFSYRAPKAARVLIELRYAIAKGDVTLPVLVNGKPATTKALLWSTDGTWQIDTVAADVVRGENRMSLGGAPIEFALDLLNVLPLASTRTGADHR